MYNVKTLIKNYLVLNVLCYVAYGSIAKEA